MRFLDFPITIYIFKQFTQLTCDNLYLIYD